MKQQSYDYHNREGVLPISWNAFHGLCKALAKAVASFRPELILAIGRGGYYPGTLLAHMLRVELFPVRLSRRVKDVVQHEHPQWLLRPPAQVDGRRLLLVDEICSTGETLQLVEEEVMSLGAAGARSAVLYAHSPGVSKADYIGLISDALILNPWDREILQDGSFTWHPEYAGAMAKQGIRPEASLLIDAQAAQLAKGG